MSSSQQVFWLYRWDLSYLAPAFLNVSGNCPQTLHTVSFAVILDGRSLPGWILIAGDIIRTVVVADTLENVATLALIILIRTILSITLHLEVEGRWPWQEGAQDDKENTETA